MNKKLCLEHTIRNLIAKNAGQLDEYAGVLPAIGKVVTKVAPKVADDAAKMLDDLLTKPKSLEAPVVPAKPAVKPKPKVTPVPSEPAPVTSPATKLKPASPSIKAPEAALTTKPKGNTEPSPATKPSTKTSPLPVPGPMPGKSGSPNKQKAEEPKDKTRKRMPFPVVHFEPVPLTTKGGHVPVDTYTHMAQDRRTYGESVDADAERTKIEVVARLNNKNRTRQAEIIRKIIEEKKNKKKNISTVEINPQLKPEEPDQN